MTTSAPIGTVIEARTANGTIMRGTFNPITTTQSLVTFAAEGFYDIGIKAQRVVSGQVVSESVIAWSNDPLFAQGGNDFGVQYYLSPAGARNMR